MRPRNAAMVPLIIIILGFCFLWSLRFAESKVPQDEVDALKLITTTMGAKHWEFNSDSCEVIKLLVLTPEEPRGSEHIVECQCNLPNDAFCHVVKITLKRFSLPGMLPPELVKLPYIRDIDLAYNYLGGTIPKEWASMQLKTISLLGNRLSGEIPKLLGNITSLTYLNLEANQFSGSVPPELGKLINLETLMLSSNKLSGSLPISLSGLVNLTDLRINDNNFDGTIPDFIQNWKQLVRLEMHGSGLKGPIPPTISLLTNLVELRISDINGTAQDFPKISNATRLRRLVLRNCNISGEIPADIWHMMELQMLDVSFNRLVGKLPDDITGKVLKFVFLTGNMLSGIVPDSVLRDGSNIDLSYNNFTWQSPDQPACRENMNMYLNLFKSSLHENPLKRILPCQTDLSCPKYGCSLHVNCGGNDLTVKENKRKVFYEGDARVEGGTSKYFRSSNSNWGFSSTGDFMDDNDFMNARFSRNLPSTTLSELYSSARLSPVSLTYFGYCLENGEYTVDLHFAEIQFTSDNTYSSLGYRMFDIYIQGQLFAKDFNIVTEAGGPMKQLIKPFKANVTDNIIEIRFYWASKGTTRIPESGDYGPLISAISVHPNFKTCSAGGKKATAYIIVAAVAAFAFVLAIGILCWKGYFRCRKRKGKDFEGLEFQTISYSLKQIKAATNNFDIVNKIGEGGFGPVYKGQLSDGTLVAVKQLSSQSRQGNREFMNEIGMISCLQHPNLVKLHGCCIQGDQLLLVYEYLENNNLARALLEGSTTILDWPTRFKICLGIAKGLAYLHEESPLKIVHRDIKATNVLLDQDLNPKISDFGLARLNDQDEKTHISTRVAGTIGYMAPEYALWGYLTYKADVYSFGVVALEIVSGKNNNNYMPSNNCICLLDWESQQSELIAGKVNWKGQPAKKGKHGGLRASTLVLALFAFENLATLALAVNLVTYFVGIMHFNIDESANHLTNYMAISYILSVFMAFLADTCLGRFTTLIISASFEFVGLGILALQAHSPKLKPRSCNLFDPTIPCAKVHGGNEALLFTGLYLLAMGSGGIKATLPSHGADQFEEKDPKEAKQMSSFFNMFLLAVCIGGAGSLTFVVWIQDNKGWEWGFATSAFAVFAGILVLVVGLPLYRIHVIQETNPLLDIIQVYVAAVRNRSLQLPRNSNELHEISKEEAGEKEIELLPHRDVFRFLDKAAVQATPSQKLVKPSSWRLCSVTQVENAKILLSMVPIFCCTFLITLCQAQLQTFSIQQAITMDRKLTKSFSIPGASLAIIPVVFLLFLIPFYDRIVVPLARRFTGTHTGITHLQRIGVGLLLTATSMAVAGIVEVKRKNVAKTHNMLDAIPLLQPLPITVFWLSIQYFIFGIADLFTYVGLLEFFYSQAPKALKSVSTCFLWSSMAVGYFMSTILVNVVNKATKKITRNGGWLVGNNLNRNHLNLFYFLLAVLCIVNFAVYLFVSRRYNYRPQVSPEVLDDEGAGDRMGVSEN